MNVCVAEGDCAGVGGRWMVKTKITLTLSPLTLRGDRALRFEEVAALESPQTYVLPINECIKTCHPPFTPAISTVLRLDVYRRRCTRTLSLPSSASDGEGI